MIRHIYLQNMSFPLVFFQVQVAKKLQSTKPLILQDSYDVVKGTRC